MVYVNRGESASSIAGLMGSNPTEGMDVCEFSSVFFVRCCVGSGLCYELITRPEECVCVYI
jgi:hypothetical protein